MKAKVKITLIIIGLLLIFINIGIISIMAAKNADNKEIYKSEIKFENQNKIQQNSKLTQSRNNIEYNYYIIKFQKELSDNDKTFLEKNKFIFYYSLDKNFWYIALPKDKFSCLVNKQRLNQCFNNELESKIQFAAISDSSLKLSSNLVEDNLYNTTYINDTNVVLLVYFNPDITYSQVSDIITENGWLVDYYIDKINLYAIIIPKNDIERLVNLPEVKRVEQILADTQKQMVEVKNSIGAITEYNNISYDVSGNGIYIMQFEEGQPGGHYALEGKIINPLGNESIDSHSTAVAGIMVANSNKTENDIKYNGISPNATVVRYSRGNILERATLLTYNTYKYYSDALENYNLSVITNSWGVTAYAYDCDTGGSYIADSELIDSFINSIYTPNAVPIVWSAGNMRLNNPCWLQEYATILPRASSKNTITVGAVESNTNKMTDFSSWGPTLDGRIKPEIVAPGCKENQTGITILSTENNYTNIFNSIFGSSPVCGTSFTAPQVAATIALMADAHNIYEDNQTKLLPSTYKAILTNTAIDLKKDGSGEIITDGPDLLNGFGLLNTKDSIDTIKNKNYIEYLITDIDEVLYHKIQLPKSQTTFKVTLAWDDLPGDSTLELEEPQLVNDLDLFIISPNQKIYYPWTINGEDFELDSYQTRSDHLNVIEQVYVSEEDFEPGNWTIVIRATKLESNQTYSIAYTKDKDLFNEDIIANNEEETQTEDLQEDNEDQILFKENLVIYYPFDNNTKDYSGKYFNAFLRGDDEFYDEGIRNNALWFNGENNYLETPSLGHILNYNKDWTISFWFLDSGYQTDYNFIGGTDGGSNSKQFVVVENLVRVTNYAGYSDKDWQVIFNPLSKYQWHNYIISWNQTGELKIYLDGNFIGSDKLGKLDEFYPNNKPLIGALNDGLNKRVRNYYTGYMDEFAIWNKTLEKSEINELYNSYDFN